MFDYDEAFSRNLGWVTESEQAILKSKRVAIAGLGGVGGSHLLTLTRLGIGNFNIADLDVFELANFNRQAGAMVDNIGVPKIDALTGMALSINPELVINRYETGVDSDNIDDFLQGVDLYVDALDFFAFDARKAVFSACAEKGIPAITAAPLGMGSAFLAFMPGEMTFEEYFRLEGQPEDEQALRLMLGLSPALLQMGYLVDDSRVDFQARKGPSTPMACEMCAGVAGTQALKILLNRGGVPAAPSGLHYDAYKNKLSRTWRPWGNNNPIQRLGLMIARSKVMGRDVPVQDESASPSPDSPIARILDYARWAPSGDNEQPWRFEILDDRHCVLHTHDTREWCVYDLDGASSQLAVGALLETIAIAASAEGMRARFDRRTASEEGSLIVDVALEQADGEPSPLVPYIKTRVTQRSPFSTRPLLAHQKRALEDALGDGYRVIWLEGRRTRWRMAKLLFHNAHIRLTTPEAYEVHRRNIEWGAKFSEDRLPEHALGVDLLTRKVMRWVLASWNRVAFMNRFLAGTWLPRLQMDLRNGYCCGAHFIIVADHPATSIDDYLEGGRATQRFWLESTRQGLQFQPEMTPLIFSRYVDQSLAFTSVASEQQLAAELAAQLRQLVPDNDLRSAVFMGRVGFATAPESRSIRLPLARLLTTSGD